MKTKDGNNSFTIDQETELQIRKSVSCENLQVNNENNDLHKDSSSPNNKPVARSLTDFHFENTSPSTNGILPTAHYRRETFCDPTN